MTSEGKADTEAWAKQHGAKYPYAYDTDDNLARHFGVRGIPDAVLVDSTGVVLWQGHPAQLKESDIERALKGALPKPLYVWPAATARAKQALVQGNYSQALELAKRMGDEYRDMIQGRIDHLLTSIESAMERGDYLLAQNMGERAAKLLRDLPEEEKVAELMSRMTSNSQAIAILDGQRKLNLLAQRAKVAKNQRDASVTLEAMATLLRQFPGSHLARQAGSAMSDLKQRMRRMR